MTAVQAHSTMTRRRLAAASLGKIWVAPRPGCSGTSCTGAGGAGVCVRAGARESAVPAGVPRLLRAPDPPAPEPRPPLLLSVPTFSPPALRPLPRDPPDACRPPPRRRALDPERPPPPPDEALPAFAGCACCGACPDCPAGAPCPGDRLRLRARVRFRLLLRPPPPCPLPEVPPGCDPRSGLSFCSAMGWSAYRPGPPRAVPSWTHMRRPSRRYPPAPPRRRLDQEAAARRYTST